MDSPSTEIPKLPDDIAALHALVLATLSERDAAVTERDLLYQRPRPMPLFCMRVSKNDRRYVD
jgi:hypothetical protein